MEEADDAAPRLARRAPIRRRARNVGVDLLPIRILREPLTPAVRGGRVGVDRDGEQLLPPVRGAVAQVAADGEADQGQGGPGEEQAGDEGEQEDGRNERHGYRGFVVLGHVGHDVAVARRCCGTRRQAGVDATALMSVDEAGRESRGNWG